MKHRWIRIVGAMVLVGTVFPTLFIAQTAQTAQTEQAPGPYARIAIMRALDGHTAASLSNPVSPAEDERDNLLNVLPHAQFLGNGVYEFLPTLSRGNGVPTPTLRAEYTTVELNQGAGKAFEAALAVEQSKLQGETLWY